MSTSALQIVGNMQAGYEEILSPEALIFIEKLEKKFGQQRRELLARRIERQKQLDAGVMPNFLPDTKEIRESDWQVAPTPIDLQNRRVEITGPVERKMVINALNSGAKVFMADFEDAQSPTWEGIVEGQINLRDANKGTIDFTSPEGKEYRLKKDHAVLLARPRGWHLEEKHILLEGQPISGSLMDFGLYLFHNAKTLQANGSGPYYYLPKLEGYLEARLWNEVIDFAEDELGLERGTAKVTVLIETILASFEMHEILYELREHCVGLNCGRWDYIFSFIKRFRNNPDFVLPDRHDVKMTTHFLRSYSQLVIQTCHRRDAHAMGGMSPFIPIKSDPEANEKAMAQVRADKEREANDGHDGTWVAHPGLVPIAMEVFDKYMSNPNQKDKLRADVNITAADLTKVPDMPTDGKITETGLRNNINVAIQYMEAWLGGNGCVPINNLMEDAATAEISRAQIWQWIRYPKGVLEDGRKVTIEMVKQLIGEEQANIRSKVGEQHHESGHYALAAELLEKISTEDSFEEFLTLVAYEHLA